MYLHGDLVNAGLMDELINIRKYPADKVELAMSIAKDKNSLPEIESLLNRS
jgi:hypothetical protein